MPLFCLWSRLLQKNGSAWKPSMSAIWRQSPSRFKPPQGLWYLKEFLHNPDFKVVWRCSRCQDLICKNVFFQGSCSREVIIHDRIKSRVSFRRVLLPGTMSSALIKYAISWFKISDMRLSDCESLIFICQKVNASYRRLQFHNSLGSLSEHVHLWSPCNIQVCSIVGSILAYITLIEAICFVDL